jgi:hypothetical protein
MIQLIKETILEYCITSKDDLQYLGKAYIDGWRNIAIAFKFWNYIFYNYIIKIIQWNKNPNIPDKIVYESYDQCDQDDSYLLTDLFMGPLPNLWEIKKLILGLPD